jgi:PAS domain S-box-containing protein
VTGVMTSSEQDRSSIHLQRLYEISTLLTRFESVGTTIPAIIAVVARTLSLGTVILIEKVVARPRVIAWRADGVDDEDVAAATAHARRAYAYLRGPGALADFDHESPDPGEPHVREPRHYVTLPLTVGRRPVFGTFQIQGRDRLDETELVFINGVVNQLAIALSRQSAIDTLQQDTEIKQHDAEQRQAIAEVERGQAQQVSRIARGQQIRAEAERDVAIARRATSETQRSVAEALLEHYEGLVDNLDHAFIWEADAHSFQLAYASARIETLLGYPRKRWLDGRDFWTTCVHADDRELVFETFSKALREQRDQRCDHRCIAADGQVLWFHTGVHAARAPIPRLQGVSLDITAAKRAEEELRVQLDLTRRAEASSREAAERFWFLAESMPQKIFTATADGAIDYFNRQWAAFTALSLEEIRGWGWRQLIHPDDVEEHLRMWRHSVASGEPFTFEHRLRSADGSYRWHLSRAHAMRGSDGHVAMWLGSNTDIDDSKRADRERRLLAELGAWLIMPPTYRDTLHAMAKFLVPQMADLCIIDAMGPDGEVATLEIVFSDPDPQRDLGELVKRYAPQASRQSPTHQVLASGQPLLLSDVPSHDPGDELARVMQAIAATSMMVLPLVTHHQTLGAITFVLIGARRRFGPDDFSLGQAISRLVAVALDNARLQLQSSR